MSTPNTEGREHTVRLDVLPRHVLVGCLYIIAGLVVLDIFINYFGYIEHASIQKIFNIAREQSLPTWFASTQAVAVGLAVTAILLVRRARGARRYERFAWGAFAAFFVFIGIDDAAAIHERIGTAFEDAYEANGASLPTWGWQFIVAPAFGLMGLMLVLFVWRRFRALGLCRYIIAALACWVVAVGLDSFEGVDDEFKERTGAGIFAAWAEHLGVKTYTVSHFWKVTEEVLEMVGTSLFLYAFLKYLAFAADGMRLRLAGPPTEGTDQVG